MATNKGVCNLPRKRDETNQEHMDRLRAVRGLPPQTRDNLMERTRAAVCYVNAGSGRANDALKLTAFLSLFHPEIEPGSPRYIALMQDARQRDSAR
jgi:hypothetical protein